MLNSYCTLKGTKEQLCFLVKTLKINHISSKDKKKIKFKQRLLFHINHKKTKNAFFITLQTRKEIIEKIY